MMTDIDQDRHTLAVYRIETMAIWNELRAVVTDGWWVPRLQQRPVWRCYPKVRVFGDHQITLSRSAGLSLKYCCGEQDTYDESMVLHTCDALVALIESYQETEVEA